MGKRGVGLKVENLAFAVSSRFCIFRHTDYPLMTSANFLDLPPLLSACGTITLPGSKSISNRILLLSALAQGATEVRDVLLSDDTERMLDGLRTLGVGVEQVDKHIFRVQGCSGNFPVKDADLFLGNAGTAFRPLTAALALSGGRYRLSGVARMHERPIGDLVDALRVLGAHIDYLGSEGFPPLEIFPAKLSGVVRVSVRGDVSSQFLTALLMALPLLDREVTVDVVGELISKPYIEITLTMMARFGVTVRRDGWRSFTVAEGSRYVSLGMIYVEGDASSASYFLAAGAIGGGPVRIEGVGSDSIQGDVRFADALALMGAQILQGSNWMEARAPAGGKMKAIDLDCNHIPDAAMTLAVAAVFAEGTPRCATSPVGALRKLTASRQWRLNCARLVRRSWRGRILFVSLRPRKSGMQRSIPMMTTAWRCVSRLPRLAQRGSESTIRVVWPRHFRITLRVSMRWCRLCR